MKRYTMTAAVVIALNMISGCGYLPEADVYDIPVDPYKPVNEEDLQLGECIITLGEEVSVAGQGAWYKDGNILISKGGIYRITGKYESGGINVSTDDPVKLIFEDAQISNPDGFAVTSDADKLIIASEGESTITGCGGEYGSSVYSNGNLLIAGAGNMYIYNGIFSHGRIDFGRNVSTVCEIYSADGGYFINDTLHVF